ncbi:MAG: glucose 1-dehydrogenase [Rhodospirillales bacterium]|jgi:3-oxoacyl-[acyl-carrier protein] reductase
MRLQNKIALITGGASGFGEAIAKQYAAEGAAVMVTDLDPVGARRVATEINSSGGRAESHQADVTKAADVEAMTEATIKAFGGLDILVNNAGVPQRIGRFETVLEDAIDRIFDVNVKSWLKTTRAALPHLEARGGGSIVNTASIAGLRPRPGAAWYNASKAAACSLTISMASELGEKNIRVNALCPVAAETPLFEEVVGGQITDEDRQRFISGIPLGRLATPADVARAAVYLASDDAQFLTGVLLPIDGGRTTL